MSQLEVALGEPKRKYRLHIRADGKQRCHNAMINVAWRKKCKAN